MMYVLETYNYCFLLPLKLGTQGVLTQQDLKREAVLTYAEEFLGKPYKHKHGNQILIVRGMFGISLSKVDVVVTRSSISQIHDGKGWTTSMLQNGEIFWCSVVEL